MKKVAVVVKGYPRLSETFIAQELLGLEQAGVPLLIVALRRPAETKRHPVHDEIKAGVHYLPEYLHDEWGRVIRSLAKALVLAAECPGDVEWLHAHFIHTPASVTSYASQITGLPWTCSAHAKDIWTTPATELAAKLRAARWTVTCTKAGFERLNALAGGTRVHLSYHGLDLRRFGPFEEARARRDGGDPGDPVLLLSVGRAVEKKGYGVLLRALALLPDHLNWRFIHIGGGELLADLNDTAIAFGLSERISWLGALPQAEVLAQYRAADVFVLACRVADDGDRDGLPNVLVEAASQRLLCISTTVSGVPELLSDGVDGLLVEPDDPQELAGAIERAIRDPAFRDRLGLAAERRVREHFDHQASIAQLLGLFEAEWRQTP